MNATAHITPRDDESAWEALREECLDEFEAWQRADYEAREFEDFGNWLANKARWNGSNKYADAMNWRERLSDASLLEIHKDHKRFNRVERRLGGRS